MIRFIVLQGGEEVELRRRIDETTETDEVKEMISVYEERGIEKGKQEGINIGVEQGLLLGQRRSLLRILIARFGTVPAEIAAKIDAVTDTAVLDTLLERAVTAASLNALELT